MGPGDRVVLVLLEDPGMVDSVDTHIEVTAGAVAKDSVEEVSGDSAGVDIVGTH